MKLKCLLVDDEPLALQILKRYVDTVDQLEIAGSCNNAFKALEILQTKKIDLLFLDINMPKLSGTSLVKALQHPPKIIFTTAFKEFAIDAFEADAVDYLLKPFSLERFLKAVHKVIHYTPDVEAETVRIDNPGFLYFRADRKMVKVFLDEILYIESLKDYVKIFCNYDKPLLVKQPLSSVEAMLPSNDFLRIHRSFIVNKNKITAYTHHDIEIGEVELPIGRLYSNNIHKLA